MTKDVNNDRHYTADENKTFVNKQSGIRYGNDLYLSTEDKIGNYSEEPMTEEEIAEIEAQNKERNERQRPARKGQR